jgi:hypothetical protein
LSQATGSAGQTTRKVVSPDKKSWIEIELLDQQGKPVPNEEYQIELPDGSTVDGNLDGMGLARVDGIDPGTCKITFPNLDKRIWRRK